MSSPRESAEIKTEGNFSGAIVVRMPNWVGDTVMATPLLQDLRTHFPQATLTAMCHRSVAPLCVGNPYIDEIFSFSRPNEFIRREESRDLIYRLRQGKYALGILAPNSLSSAWWLWRGHVQRRIGFATDGRRFLLTDPLPVPPQKGKEHLVETYKRILLPLGIPLSPTPPRLFVQPQERKEARLWLDSLGIPPQARILGISPTAAFGPAKCWPPVYFKQLMERLLDIPDLYFLYFADPSGIATIQTICRDLTPSAASRVFNLAGKTTLRQCIALIEQCSAFLTNDSGLMHVAAAFPIPLVALFGSTNPVVTGPYQHGTVIRTEGVSCAPCLKKVCPIDFRCMHRLTVEQVYKTVCQMLVV